MHNMPGIEVGKFGICDGPIMAAIDELRQLSISRTVPDAMNEPQTNVGDIGVEIGDYSSGRLPCDAAAAPMMTCLP